QNRVVFGQRCHDLPPAWSHWRESNLSQGLFVLAQCHRVGRYDLEMRWVSTVLNHAKFAGKVRQAVGPSESIEILGTTEDRNTTCRLQQARGRVGLDLSGSGLQAVPAAEELRRHASPLGTHFGLDVH